MISFEEICFEIPHPTEAQNSNIIHKYSENIKFEGTSNVISILVKQENLKSKNYAWNKGGGRCCKDKLEEPRGELIACKKRKKYIVIYLMYFCEIKVLLIASPI